MAIKYLDFKKKGLSLAPFLKFHQAASVVIFGTDQLAEECSQEMVSCGVRIEAFIDLEPRTKNFLGHPLLSLADLTPFPVDMVIIASNSLWYAKENAYILHMNILQKLQSTFNAPGYTFFQMMQQTLVFEHNLALYNTPELKNIKKYIFTHHSIGSLPQISTEDEQLLYICTYEDIEKTPPIYNKIYHDTPSFSKNYIKELITLPGWINDADNAPIRMADKKSPYHNVIGGCRLTTDVPEQFSHTCHLIGPCMAYGYGCEDRMTIASFLQRKLNITFPEWRVINHSVFDHVQLELHLQKLLHNIVFRDDDIILYFNYSNYHYYHRKNSEYTKQQAEAHNFQYIDMYEVLAKECTKQKLYISDRHIAPDGCKLYAEVMFDVIKDQLHKHSDTNTQVSTRKGISPKIHRNTNIPPDIKHWLDSLQLNRFPDASSVGAIVMNCNPFTSGHRYIIEQALKKIDYLYIFVVEEDKSYFPFDVRLQLVQEGVQDIQNVKVIPSGKFIISTQTFGEYFSKDAPKNSIINIDASSDLHIFSKYIAPALNIKTRFVGEEPFCQVTRQYNAAMQEILPQYGIDVTIFKRRAVNNTAISASQVRKIFQHLQEIEPTKPNYTVLLSQLKELVPQTTFKHLLSMLEKQTLSSSPSASRTVIKNFISGSTPQIKELFSSSILPHLLTAEDCRALGKKIPGKHVIALWATAMPRSSVDILLLFRRMLQQRGYFCLLFLKSNAVDTFFTISVPEDRDGFVYILEKASLLEHCPFIDALFSHDYCCGSACQEFRGKLYYFQHNIFSSGPLPLRDMYADGLITPSCAYNTGIDYTIIPNSLKRGFTKDIKIIPAGYPKIDILTEVAGRQTPPFKRVSYYPIMLNDFTRRHILSDMSVLLRKFLHAFFKAFPDWEFVVRPFPPDRKSPFFKDIADEFAHEKLILDTGEDNVTSLVCCDIFITDYSSSYLNYAYTTLRPTIFLQPDCKSDTDNDFGYIAKTSEEAITALNHALKTLPQWEEKLRRQRACRLCNPGKALAYLCDRMESLLQGRLEPDWVSIPKHDTPYTSPSAWLRLFSLPILKKSQGFFLPFLQEANKLCGKDPRIALAALRAYIQAWHCSPLYADHWRQLQNKTEEAINQTPPRWCTGLLRFLNKKKDMQDITMYFLAYALYKTNQDTPAIRKEIQECLQKTLSLQLCSTLRSKAAELMLCYGMYIEAIRSLSKIREADEIPVTIRPAFAMLQIQKGDRESACTLLQKWENDQVQPGQLGLALIYRMVQLAEEGCQLPAFFFSKGKNLKKIILYNVPVYFYDVRHAKYYLDPIFAHLLAEARTDKSLWTQTLAAARLCRMGDAVALCAWEMFKAQCLSPKIMEELEAEGFGPKLTGLRQVLDRFVKTHRSSHSSIQ